MSNEEKAICIVEKMYEQDAYSNALKMEIIEVIPGFCSLSLVVAETMLNGHSVAHGGISYALADSCLAFASNSHGLKALSTETSIAHLRPVKLGDRLQARSEELQNGRTLGRYKVMVTNQDEKQVAIFYGTVFKTGESWEV